MSSSQEKKTGYKFEIAVLRSPHYCASINRSYPRAARLLASAFDAVSSEGIAYIRLSNPHSEKQAYYYANTQEHEFMGFVAGRGELRMITDDIGSHVSREFAITPGRFRDIQQDLVRLEERGPAGLYSAFFNNSATFAASFARKHGFPVPRPVWPTPRSLALALQKIDPAGPELTG